MGQLGIALATALVVGSAGSIEAQDEVRLYGVPAYVDPSDRLSFELAPRRTGYMLVIEQDPITGWSEQRFPLDGAEGGWVQGGRTYALSDGRGGRGQRVGGPPGQRDLYVLWQPTPFRMGSNIDGPRRDGLEVVGADRMHAAVDLRAYRPSATYWVSGVSRPAAPPIVIRGGAVDPWVRYPPRWIDPRGPAVVICVGCDHYRWSTWPDPYWVPGWGRDPWGRDRWSGDWRDGDPWRLHDPWRDPWRPDPWRNPARGGRAPDWGTPRVRPVAPPEWGGRSRPGAPQRPETTPARPAPPRTGGSSGGSAAPAQPTVPARPSVPPAAERPRSRPGQAPARPTPLSDERVPSASDRTIDRPPAPGRGPEARRVDVPPMTPPSGATGGPERPVSSPPPARTRGRTAPTDPVSHPTPETQPPRERPVMERPTPTRPEPTRPDVERVPAPRPGPDGRSTEAARPPTTPPAPPARSRPPTRPVDSPS